MVFIFAFARARLAVCLFYHSRSVVIVYGCLFTHGHAHCLDIEAFIVKLSEVSERAEMDISLCDSQRSDCQPSP